MLKQKINSIDGFTPTQEEKIVKATTLAIMAANTEEFKEKILNYSYELKITTGRLWWKHTETHKIKGFHFEPGEPIYTPEEVYNAIIKGAEILSPEVDYEMDLWLVREGSFWRSSATAYGYPSTNTIHIYSWWVNGSTIPQLANTIFHEWLHKVAFSHSFKHSHARPHSVPYAVGDIIQEIIEKNFDWVKL